MWGSLYENGHIECFNSKENAKWYCRNHESEVVACVKLTGEYEVNENTEITTELFIKESDWARFINENFKFGHGGYEWSLLDFPREGYRKIYATVTSLEKYVLEVNESNQREKARYRKTMDKLKEINPDAYYGLLDVLDKEKRGGQEVQPIPIESQ